MKTYENGQQQKVAEFHRAFGHPDRIETPGALPLDRVPLRLALIEEEGNAELLQATAFGGAAEIIDALIDTAYVCLGALVEMGQPLQQPSDSFEYSSELTTAAMQFQLRLRPRLGILKSMFGQEATAATAQLSCVVHEAFQAIEASGLAARPFFDEVHSSNMSKLGADGLPIRSRGEALDGYPEGKVLKGPNYHAPDLAAVLERVRGGYTTR